MENGQLMKNKLLDPQKKKNPPEDERITRELKIN
jgi:hypothetical protein